MAHVELIIQWGVIPNTNGHGTAVQCMKDMRHVGRHGSKMEPGDFWMVPQQLHQMISPIQQQITVQRGIDRKGSDALHLWKAQRKPVLGR